MQKSIAEKSIQLLKMTGDSKLVIKDCGPEYKDMINRRLDGLYLYAITYLVT